MTTDNLHMDMTFAAGADLSTSQYKFVELNGSSTNGVPQVTVCNAATDKPLGVLQNNPTSGVAAQVRIFGATKVQGDASLALGVLIGTSGDGQADAKTPGTDTTEYVVGVVTQAVSNAGELAQALINCLAPHRAA